MLKSVVAVALFVLFSAPMLVAFTRATRRRTARQALALFSTTTGSTAPRVLVPLANGSEEIEAVTIIDTLVRGGVKVTSATVHAGDSLTVTCSRGVKIEADYRIADCLNQKWDMIVCPGGMPGSEHLRDSVALTEILKMQNQRKGLIGAICAAPAVVLKTHGILTPSTPATGYPADKFKQVIGASYRADEDVVVADNIVTSQGPGTAMSFSIKLVELLVGKDKAAAVAKEMLTAAPK